MSLQFSDTTNKAGIVQTIDFWTKANLVSYTIEERTRDINLALDKVFSFIFPASGRWQFDDSNHTDYPTITTDIVSGQRDYTFTTDEQGNLILDVYKVMRKNSDGIYEEIYPVDTESDEGMQSFYDGQGITGIPNSYNKTANGITFDVLPDYNSTEGLKIFINREGSYFTKTDTTKKPGFAGLFHEYLALEPSYKYACVNQLKNKEEIYREMLRFEQAIKQHYRDRSRDEQPFISGIDTCSV